MNDDIKNFLESMREEFKADHEIRIQQQSASHSTIMAEIRIVKQDVANLKQTMDGWKMGGKVVFGFLVVLGGLITWTLNTFGIKIGLR